MIKKIKVWHKVNPEKDGDFICRMDNGSIKMCHFDGSKWLDMWQDSLVGDVTKWMFIPDGNETIQITTADAVNKLVSSLKEDNGFYETWKSNIAMSFVDNYHWARGKGGIPKIANDSADYFLKLLMK